ncbi:hypothetical protein ACHAXT_003136 [Thalassiosira profunda]
MALSVRLAAVVVLWRHGASSFTPAIHPRQLRTRPTALRATPPRNELHLLTFDLDDTIFPIGPVVADANVAQLQTLVRFGYEEASNDEIVAASKQIRTELRAAGDVITYTDLRKQSIRREIERVTGDDTVHESVAEAVFDAWLSERHASADRNLFPHASASLQIIREQHPNVVIGAITNGRGNPLCMPSMQQFFDFCVSGEDEDVFPKRKPDEGIYQAALSKYNELQTAPGDASFNWLHVGDDLANDVGASACCGAKSIWITVDEDEPCETPSWSTATQEEMQKRAVLDTNAKEHVSAKICSLEELPDAILHVLEQ